MATAVAIDAVTPVASSVARTVARTVAIAVTDIVVPMVRAFHAIVPVSTARGVVVDDMRSRVKSKEEQVGYGCNVLGGDVPEFVFESRFEAVAGLSGSRPEQHASRESGGDPRASGPDAGRRSRGHCLLEIGMAMHWGLLGSPS